LFVFILSLATGFAQTATGSLRGKVSDPSGAVVQGATVTATSADGKKITATTTAQGNYELKNLPPGSYTVTVSAKGFALDTEPSVTVAAGLPQQFDIALQIAVDKEQIQVDAQSNTVDTSAENNASALVIKGKDLEALSDDPDELQNELEALAGPSAGPNGGQMYIDGFTAGQLPPKASIREIRVNQNPFSAEYDKLGYGRIEIFTKPGLDKFHGQFFVIGNDNAFNADNPFAVRDGATIPPYHSEQFSGNVSGPLVSKKSSFFFNVERRNINNESVVFAQTLDPTTYDSTQFTQAVSTPATRTNISPRFDFQLTPNNTLTARYQYWLENETNDGIGQNSLPTLAYNTREAEHTLQISDTQILSSSTINETRFQYVRDLNVQNPLSFAPQISVQGAFSTGGNSTGYFNDHEDRYELQNYTSIVHGKHMFKFGGRLRATRDANASIANFNGSYTFSSLYSYALTEYYLTQGVTIPQMQADPTAYCTLPASSNITPQPNQCAGVSQYSQTIGAPATVADYVDAGLYFQDEYKVRPNLTLSYGLRFETQNAIHDHGDFAPRLGLAWGLGSSKSTPKTVLRAGYGIFYDRFAINNILNSERLNGTTQQQFILTNPCFYEPTASVSESTLTGCGGASSTLSHDSRYEISPNLHAPYTMQAAVSLERQLWKNATGALTYINSRGDHQLVLINANAPLPGTYSVTDPSAAVYPYGNVGNIFEYLTEGTFKQNQLIANINWRAGSRFSLFGNYSLSYADSDVTGSTTAPGFVSDSYDITEDYGRANFSVRNRGMIGGSFSLPYAFRFSPFIIINSGTPYNLYVGQDLNGDSIFNNRPAFAGTVNSGNLKQTPFGLLDLSPLPGERLVPINYGTGPAAFTFNMRFGKTFGLGPKLEKAAGADGGPQGGSHGGGPRGGNPFGNAGGGGRGGMFGGDTSDRKYSLTFNVLVRNLFNNVNLAAPVGNVNSPYFGQSIALAGGPFGSGAYNRRLDLQAVFSF
jgi:hypothetical protein